MAETQLLQAKNASTDADILLKNQRGDGHGSCGIVKKAAGQGGLEYGRVLMRADKGLFRYDPTVAGC
jgi:hypothetical protein